MLGATALYALYSAGAGVEQCLECSFAVPLVMGSILQPREFKKKCDTGPQVDLV